MKSSDARFGAAVRSVRVARRMTQGQLAAYARLSRQQLIAIEGGHWPREGTLRRVVGALGFTSYGDLLAAANGPISALKTAAREESLRGSRTGGACCTSCGAQIADTRPQRGRPRLRCRACASDRAALGRAWRRANGDRVAAYNASRRASSRAKEGATP